MEKNVSPEPRVLVYARGAFWAITGDLASIIDEEVARAEEAVHAGPLPKSRKAKSTGRKPVKQRTARK